MFNLFYYFIRLSTCLQCNHMVYMNSNSSAGNLVKHYSCPEQWDWRIWNPRAIEIAVFYGHDMLSQGRWWLMSRSMINVNVIIIRTSPQYDPTWHTKVCVFGVKRHVSSRCSMNCGLLKGDKNMVHACAMKSVLKHRNMWHHNLNMLCIVMLMKSYEQLEGVTWVTWCGAWRFRTPWMRPRKWRTQPWLGLVYRCIWSSDSIFNETSEVM